MRELTDDEMFVEERQEERSHYPEVGEVLQGLFYAILNSKSLLKKVEANEFEDFSNFIIALEELGKAAPLANLLISLVFNTEDVVRKWEDYNKLQRDHKKKLKRLLDGLLNLGASANIKKTSALFSFLNESFASGTVIDFLRQEVASGLHAKIHLMRLSSLYSEINENQVAISPNHEAGQINKDIIEPISEFFVAMIEQGLKLFKKIWPSLYDTICSCYHETDMDIVKDHKAEINRVVERAFPAFKKAYIEFLSDKLGEGVLTFDLINDNAELSARLKNELTSEDLSNIGAKAKLIAESNEEIENKYIYGPLKEEFRKKYQNIRDSKK